MVRTTAWQSWVWNDDIGDSYISIYSTVSQSYKYLSATLWSAPGPSWHPQLPLHQLTFLPPRLFPFSLLSLHLKSARRLAFLSWLPFHPLLFQVGLWLLLPSVPGSQDLFCFIQAKTVLHCSSVAKVGSLHETIGLIPPSWDQNERSQLDPWRINELTCQQYLPGTAKTHCEPNQWSHLQNAVEELCPDQEKSKQWQIKGSGRTSRFGKVNYSNYRILQIITV